MQKTIKNVVKRGVSRPTKTSETLHDSRVVRVGSKTVTLTHLAKIFWKKEGYTKGDILEYYDRVAEFILPYLKNRPLVLRRQPDGVKGESFFQKNVADLAPSWAKTVPIYSEHEKKTTHYLVGQDKASLLFMANVGCIEMNPWNSRIGHLEKPDYMILDLDPEAVSFDRVVDAALAAHKVLDSLAIPNFCKTSGKRGLHIYIPLAARYDYEQVRQFSELIANLSQQAVPRITSVIRSPEKRQRRVYYDYLQNKLGATLACPYSARPWPGATVSTPLRWQEVKHGLNPGDYTIKTIFKRLDKYGDLFLPVLGKGIDLKKILTQFNLVDQQ